MIAYVRNIKVSVKDVNVIYVSDDTLFKCIIVDSNTILCDDNAIYSSNDKVNHGLTNNSIFKVIK